MASATVEAIVSRVKPFMPADRADELAASLAYGLDVIERHGDPEGLAKLGRDIEAAALALEAGDDRAARLILDEWGVTAWLPIAAFEQPRD